MDLSSLENCLTFHAIRPCTMCSHMIPPPPPPTHTHIHTKKKKGEKSHHLGSYPTSSIVDLDIIWGREGGGGVGEMSYNCNIGIRGR